MKYAVEVSPTTQVDDVHAVIDVLCAGPVDMFASSGGAATALALVASYPDDVLTVGSARAAADPGAPGEFTDDYFARPAPDPGAFGMPIEDDAGAALHTYRAAPAAS